MKFQMADGIVKLLKDVRYLPSMRKNLISIGTLVRKGFTIKIDGSGMKIMKGSNTFGYLGPVPHIVISWLQIFFNIG